MSFVSIQNGVPLAYVSTEAILLGFLVVAILPALLIIMAIALSITAYIRKHPRWLVIVTVSLLTTTALICSFYLSIYAGTARGNEPDIFLWAVPQVVLATALTMIAYMRNSLYKRRVLLISGLTTLPLIIVLVTHYLFLLLQGRIGDNDYYGWWLWLLVAGIAIGVVLKIVAIWLLRRRTRFAKFA